MENAFQLWLPDNAHLLDTKDLLRRLHQANQYLDLFLAGGMNVADYIEAIASLGVDIDDYLDSCTFNLMSGVY